MLSMQTGSIWMIQKISQALFGLHNRSSSGNCQGFCVCKGRKRHSACEAVWGPALGSTLHGLTSALLDFRRVSSCHRELFTPSHPPGIGSQLFLSRDLAAVSGVSRRRREDAYVQRQNQLRCGGSGAPCHGLVRGTAGSEGDGMGLQCCAARAVAAGRPVHDEQV